MVIISPSAACVLLLSTGSIGYGDPASWTPFMAAYVAWSLRRRLPTNCIFLYYCRIPLKNKEADLLAKPLSSCILVQGKHLTMNESSLSKAGSSMKRLRLPVHPSLLPRDRGAYASRKARCPTTVSLTANTALSRALPEGSFVRKLTSCRQVRTRWGHASSRSTYQRALGTRIGCGTYARELIQQVGRGACGGASGGGNAFGEATQARKSPASAMLMPTMTGVAFSQDCTRMEA